MKALMTSGGIDGNFRTAFSAVALMIELALDTSEPWTSLKKSSSLQTAATNWGEETVSPTSWKGSNLGPTLLLLLSQRACFFTKWWILKAKLEGQISGNVFEGFAVAIKTLGGRRWLRVGTQYFYVWQLWMILIFLRLQISNLAENLKVEKEICYILC